MITVHHLNESRSQRILWLLEEIGTPYDIKFYQRDATTRLAPPELMAVHPLGKSPVISDEHGTIIESGAIIDHLIRKHGGGALSGADIQMSFVGEIACRYGLHATHPNIGSWVKRFQARDAYKRALERGGPYSMAG